MTLYEFELLMLSISVIGCLVLIMLAEGNRRDMKHEIEYLRKKVDELERRGVKP